MEYPWKMTWDARAYLAASMAGTCCRVIDIGGGLGTIKRVMNPQEYVSIDLEKWTDDTVVADLNITFPELQSCDCIMCLGVLEYISDSDLFLTSLHQYGAKMVMSYRRFSKGGMDRANEYTFDEVRALLERNGWEIIRTEMLHANEQIYLVEEK